MTDKEKTDLIQMREILRMIAYPRRGTVEDDIDITQIAKVIQVIWTLEELESK